MEKIDDLVQLKKKAYEMRIETLKMLGKAQSGHVGGAFSIADILTFLYFNYLKHDPKDPDWQDRDYFLMSNGHVCPIWYTILAHSGYFSVKQLDRLRELNSILQGHPKNLDTPGVFNSSGPLGHGIGQAVGVAYSLRLDSKSNRVYCLSSDGEHQEGIVWENILIAQKYGLNNLTLILDRNDVQIEGSISEIMPMPDLAKIYTEAGWNVVEIDGHDYEEIRSAFEATEIAKTDKPNIIIANTVSGSGVDFMEGKPEFHDWSGDEIEAQKAIEKIQERIADI